MRTDVGFFDRLFGKKVIVELPTPDGGTRRIRVSERWWQKMQGQGQVTERQYVVTTHILDTTGGMDSAIETMDQLEELVLRSAEGPIYRVEPWKIGEHITQETYDRFADENGELYVMIHLREGQIQQACLQKELWEATRRSLG